MVFPIAFLGYCTYATWVYRRKVADRQTNFLHAHKFLFYRFRLPSKRIKNTGLCKQNIKKHVHKNIVYMLNTF